MAPNTLIDSLSIVTTLPFWFMSSGFRKCNHKLQVTKFAIIYANMAPLTVIASLSYAIYVKWTSPEYSDSLKNMSPLILLIGSMELIMSSLTLAITNVSMQAFKRRHIALLERFDSIDHRLVTEFGAIMNYEKNLRKNLILAVLFVAYYIATTIGLLIQYAEGDYMNMLNIGGCYAFITIGPHMCGYAHMNLADLLRVRYRFIQKLLRPENLMSQYGKRGERAIRIESLIEIYRELFGIIDGVNDIYGPSLLATMLHDFTLTTSQLFLLLGNSSAFDEDEGGGSWRVFLGVMFFMLPPVYKMFSSPAYMTLSINESKKCLRVIKQLDYTFRCDEVTTLVSSALLWCNHRTMEYSIGGVFASNLGMMFGIISSMSGYLLILLQLKMQEDAIGGEYMMRWRQKMEDNLENIVKKLQNL